ncbi:phosphoribosyl-ATP diphosphatase [Neorhodopirellula pilleata]|uniref:Phosphoribosyl-ATP pyrophosphatase n=1 Tax=Neorhodopirellula pilleata TaxID=2714738 RepID=A0A5C6ADN1_9BACT|nr:phosphoribosyl-ATP diphosphatase [Neorhodopirellula pilleata]TWT96353.1 Phosphoribosyl-ATP pyrophosphatase [Neorhodopirellula pilleata]
MKRLRNKPGPLPKHALRTNILRFQPSQISLDVAVSDPASESLPESPLEPLTRLMATLTHRAATRPPGSYTTKLLDGGAEKIGGKIREEAEELIEAVGEDGEEGRQHAIYEAGDLIYHTLVMLAYRGITLDEVAAELARREGVSGLAEKAARKN